MDLDPLNAYVCHALSNLEKRIRNFDRARAVLEVVVKERPTSALCVSLAELERQLGSADRAREVLRHGLKKCDKERSKLLLALAWLEEDAFSNASEARKLIEEAMKVDKNNVRVHVAKASMELRSGRINEARATLRQATALQSEDGVHYTMWATLEIDSGNFREARILLEEGSEKFPGDQFLLQRWGALESKFGSVKKARELFDRSIVIQPHAPTFVAWAILEEDQGIVVSGSVGVTDCIAAFSIMDIRRPRTHHQCYCYSFRLPPQPTDLLSSSHSVLPLNGHASGTESEEPTVASTAR